MIVKFQSKTGFTKIAITATDAHKQKSEVITVVLAVKSWVGVDPDKLACYWSFDVVNNPGLANFAKNGGTLFSLLFFWVLIYWGALMRGLLTLDVNGT